MSDDLKHDFWHKLSDGPFVMVRLTNGNDHALPMTAQLDRDMGPAKGGAIWFFTERNNRLAPGGPAMAQFVSKGHDFFACVSGQIVEEQDRAVLDRLWSPQVEAWYDQGKTDPKLLLLRMTLDNIEAWEVDMGVTGWLKMVTGIGVKTDELGDHVREPM